MQKEIVLVLSLCLLLAGCGYPTYQETPNDSEEGENNNITVEVLPKPEDEFAIEVAPLDGEPISPDGKWEVRQVGRNEGVTAGGMYAPEKVQIVDITTGEVLWEDEGYYQQSVVWSPSGKYMALARTARTYGFITIVETENWTAWDVMPPTGSNIPEYTFLPNESWGVWISSGLMDENLMVTIGRGGEEGPQTVFRCLLHMKEEQLTGTSFEQTSEVLGAGYDFDHDGIPEEVEMVTIYDNPQVANQVALYEVQVWEQGKLLWRDEAHWSHVGWNSVFAIKISEEDYLIRYLPGMWQGWADYQYQIFYLDERGQEIVYQENQVSFDTDYQNELHQFDAKALAAFLEEVHGYLDSSTLLISTEDGWYRTGGSGKEFRDDVDFWYDSCHYDENLTLEENLQAVDDYHIAMIARHAAEIE